MGVVFAFSGGGGGGAIELGAVGSISVTGVITANGADGFSAGAGGGGGGIFLHGSTVTLAGLLSVAGGAGASGVGTTTYTEYAGGGGGGGGEVLIQATGGYSASTNSRVLLNGGIGGSGYSATGRPGAGSAGSVGSLVVVVPAVSVPEPSSWLMLGLAIPALAACPPLRTHRLARGSKQF